MDACGGRRTTSGVSYRPSLWDLGPELRAPDLHSEHFPLCLIMTAPSQFLVFHSVFETRSAYVAHPGLELYITQAVILPPQSLLLGLGFTGPDHTSGNGVYTFLLAPGQGPVAVTQEAADGISHSPWLHQMWPQR